MNINDIYIAKNNSTKEIFRMFISLYYFLLLKDKINIVRDRNNCEKVISYLLKENIKIYSKFFYENFIENQNIFLFTLYNQIPLQFLKFPNKKLYLKYPLITFKSASKKLDNRYIGKEVKDIDKIWADYTNNYSKNIKKLKNRFPEIKENKQDEYDNFSVYFPIDYLFLLDDYYRNKTLLIYSDKPIIVVRHEIDREQKRILLKEYYEKRGERYIFNSRRNIINSKEIVYLTILGNITKEGLLKCFKERILRKGTNLYHQVNVNDYEKLDENNKKFIYEFFTITPYSRISDPLYLNPESRYLTQEYRVIGDIRLLDITRNIYMDNILKRERVDDLMECFELDSIRGKLEYCDYDYINPDLNMRDINYNKKNGLLLVIWKNTKYVDNTMNFRLFLRLLKIDGYFNIMSLIEKKNGEIKILGEEFFINRRIVTKNIKLLVDYTDNKSKFQIESKIRNYKNAYFDIKN